MLTSSYPRFAGDGAGSFVASLARSLVELGHDVFVVAPYDASVAEMDQGGVQVRRFRYAPTRNLHLAGHGRSLQADMNMKWMVPLLMPAFGAAAIGQMLALHRREHLDLIHGHWAVPGGALAAVASGWLRLPLVTSLHGSDVYVIEHSVPYATAARYGFRQAARVTACSDDLRRRAIGVGLDESKSDVIPYGVDVDRYARGDGQPMRQRLGLADDALVIGAMGRLVYKKGFAFLIRAMAQVLAQEPRAFGVIGGQGDLYDELHALIAQVGMTDRILLPGHINWQESQDFYDMCDLFVVPSVIDAEGNVDGLPNVLLESLASGCAVVASRVAGIPDNVQDGVTGLLVEPGDVPMLADALRRLLRQEDLRQNLGRAARAEMHANYRWDAIARRYVGVYQTALDSHLQGA